MSEPALRPWVSRLVILCQILVGLLLVGPLFWALKLWWAWWGF